MTVLMTRKKADAIKSIERDRHLISDSAAHARYEDATPDEKPLTRKEKDQINRTRDHVGR